MRKEGIEALKKEVRVSSFCLGDVPVGDCLEIFVMLDFQYGESPRQR